MGGHSGFRETSVMLALDEKHVHLEELSQPKSLHKNLSGGLDTVDVHMVALHGEKAKVVLCHNTDELNAGSGYGNVEGASREYGEKVLQSSVDYISRLVEELKAMKLPRN